MTQSEKGVEQKNQGPERSPIYVPVLEIFSTGPVSIRASSTIAKKCSPKPGFPSFAKYIGIHKKLQLQQFSKSRT